MIAQRLFLFAVGGFTLVLGSFFTYIMAQSYLNARETRSWVETPATITEAEVEERKIGEHVPVDYAARVEFTYTYNGAPFTASLLSPRGQKWAKERAKAVHDLGDLTPQLETTCWVNPSAPGTAILQHDTKAAGYSIWFPLLFVIGGGGVMIGAFRKR